MTNISLTTVWNLGPVTHRMNIRDLDAIQTSGGVVLYGTNGSTGGVISYQINAATGALSYADSQVLGPLISVDSPVHLETITLGGQDFVVNLGRHADGLEAIQINPSGDLSTRIDLLGTDSSGISTMVYHDGATRDVVFAGYWGHSDIGVYEVLSGGVLSYLGMIQSPQSVHGADLVDFRITQVGDQDIMVFASRYEDTVYSYRLSDNGGLTAADTISMSDGLPIATPSAMEIAEIGEQRFAVLASSGTSSLTVMQIQADGQLVSLDHIAANTSTRIANLTALETVSVGNRAFVVAGGANDGVSVFELMPDGRLYHWGAQEDLLTSALSNVTSVSAVVRGDGFDIYAASENEEGITQLRVDLGPLGATQIGTSGNETLTGGSGADVLYGDAGNDSLVGGDGDDVLIGGAGTNHYRGGAGADLFVLSPDGTRDTIHDFEVGVDRIDFSGLGRIYDLSDLSWSERSVGAVIQHGDRYVIIYPDDGSPLSIGDFTSDDLFNLSHVDLSYISNASGDPSGSFEPVNVDGTIGADTLTGSDAADLMFGDDGDDVLIGGNGDDVLNGGAGADDLQGGVGNDWVSYAGSRGSLRVDLMFSNINTNVAAGDTYSSIENLIGSEGFDNLRGDLGDNHIRGDRNVDYIFGRRGNDTLDGDIGDDVLFGGVGEDVLRGGANRDRAQYSESLSAVTVDLFYPNRNTGEAAGDSFDSIEDLAGGRFDDNLYGDTGANRLFGREGNDLLVGREGNDYLNGGANSDTLDGGQGNDVLRGGHSSDTFVFTEGVDIVEDFNVSFDRLRLEADLIGGGASAQTALDFASVIGGHVVFEFDTGDQLTLQNVNTLSGLIDVFEFI